MRSILCITLCELAAGCAKSADGPNGDHKSYTGPYSGQYTETTVSSLATGGFQTCTNTFTLSGTLTLTLEQTGDNVTGNASVSGLETETAHGGPAQCPSKGNIQMLQDASVNSSVSNLQFSKDIVSQGSFVVTVSDSFTGALAGGTVTGTLTWSRNGTGTTQGSSVTSHATTAMSVTLH